MRDLNAKIRTYIDAWNGRCHFVWTKTAEDILKKVNRKQNSDGGDRPAVGELGGQDLSRK